MHSRIDNLIVLPQDTTDWIVFYFLLMNPISKYLKSSSKFQSPEEVMRPKSEKEVFLIC